MYVCHLNLNYNYKLFRESKRNYMSKITSAQMSELETSVRRLNADKAFSTEPSVLNELETVSNSNVDEAILEDGEILTVPTIDEIKTKSLLFAQTFGRGKGYGVLCPSSMGGVKRLYFNSLKKNVVVYDEVSRKPVQENGRAKTIRSNSELSNAVRACATMKDILDLIVGKSIKFTFVKDGDKTRFTTAVRDANNVVTGTRETSVMNPEFVA